MFNSEEGVKLLDDASAKVTTSHEYGENQVVNALQSLNNEIAVYNMIAALNNPEIRKIIPERNINGIVKAIGFHILQNAEGLQIHNEHITDARENGHFIR